MDERKFNIAKLALKGYVCIIIASAGYYGYYLPKEDSFVLQWVIFALIGFSLLGFKNYIHYSKTKDNRIFWDIIILITSILYPINPPAIWIIHTTYDVHLHFQLFCSCK